jgi:hypothetical protein
MRKEKTENSKFKIVTLDEENRREEHFYDNKPQALNDLAFFRQTRNKYKFVSGVVKL